MTHESFDILALRPADTPEYMTPAWLSCIWSVANEPNAAKLFLADTGMKLSHTPIDQMIDQATGMDRKILEAFILWVNRTVWGPID